jgi:Zn-finger nucleic acid-binding protein
MPVKPTDQEDEYFARLEFERRGVELDKCSRCQGVWLDFGEIDQVVAQDTGFLGGVRRIFS